MQSHVFIKYGMLVRHDKCMLGKCIPIPCAHFALYVSGFSLCGLFKQVLHCVSSASGTTNSGRKYVSVTVDGYGGNVPSSSAVFWYIGESALRSVQLVLSVRDMPILYYDATTTNDKSMHVYVHATMLKKNKQEHRSSYMWRPVCLYTISLATAIHPLFYTSTDAWSARTTWGGGAPPQGCGSWDQDKECTETVVIPEGQV
jgi:hypothetical protein